MAGALELNGGAAAGGGGAESCAAAEWNGGGGGSGGDSVMSVEPGLLLCVHSIPKYSAMTVG